jgi:hypothetical protein
MSAACRGRSSRPAGSRSIGSRNTGSRNTGSRRAGSRRAGSQVLVAALVVSVLSGCTDDPDIGNAATAAAVAAPPVEVTADAAEGVLRSGTAVVSAGQLRLMLEQLLGEHVLLIAGAATDHAGGQTTDASLAVVADNTQALTDAIGLVYGDVGARAFSSLWSQHIAFFLDHARGTADGDREAVDEAADHLEHYEQGFGSFTATATGGALPADAVAQLLKVHVADINGYVAAHLDADPETGAVTLAAGHDYAADIGATLAAAVAGQGPRAFPGDTADERAEVAAELARAFANHLAVRASGADAPGAPGAPGTPGTPGTPGAPDAEEETTAVDAGSAAAARLEAAVLAAAADPTAAARSLERLTMGPVGARADADALAAALGVPELGESLVAIATAPAGDPTAPALIDAHRAAYALASTWLG